MATEILGPQIESAKEPVVAFPAIGLRRLDGKEIKYTVGVELTAEYVRNNTEFLDVTHDPALLEATLQTVAANYAPLANPEKPLTQQEVYDLLCKDGNEVEGRSIVLAAVTDLPDHRGRIVTSTMRFVFGQDHAVPGIPPIAEMDLVDAVWPNEVVGKPYSSIATVGRYCIVDDMRKLAGAGIPGHLTGNLLKLGFEISGQKFPPVEYFAAVMPRRVVRNVRSGGIEVTALGMSLKQIPGYEVGTDLTIDQEALNVLYTTADSPESMRKLHEAVAANAYYLRFSGYWLPHLYGKTDAPNLYQFQVSK